MAGTYISGLISGIDTDSLIQSIMQLEKRPYVALEGKSKDLQSKNDVLKDVNSRLTSLQTAVEKLASTETFYGKYAASGDDSIVTATAASSAPRGDYSVEVIALARAHVVAGTGMASDTSALGLVGNPIINGKTIEVTAADSLVSIRDKINHTDGIGVTASVVDTGGGVFRLVLTSSNTGVANAITATDNGDVLFGLGIVDSAGVLNTVPGGEAQDARVKINSLEVTRSTNVIDDVVNGISFTLKKAGVTTVKVDYDLGKATSAIKAFVDQYNSTLAFVRSKIAFDKDSNSAGPLLGDYSITRLESELRSIITGSIPGLPSDMNQAWFVGISTGAYGSADAALGNLVIDEERLQEALQNRLDDVARLFGAVPLNVASFREGGTARETDAFGNPVTPTLNQEIYGPLNAINGDTDSERWGTAGGGWNDSTQGVYPDILEVTFSQLRTIDKVTVYTLDSESLPASQYGIKDYTLEYFDGSSWKTLASVTGNNKGVITHEFEPVTTQRIRLNVTASNGTGDYSRIVEVEAYQQNMGLGARLAEFLKSYTESSTGVIAIKQDTINREIEACKQRLEQVQARLEQRESILREKFSVMERAIARLKAQGQFLTNQMTFLENTRLKS